MGRSYCRLHCVNEVPSGRGKTAALSLAWCVYFFRDWGVGDLRDNEPSAAPTGIVC